jgi:putative inorganic carbon (HCO3(-)) transporter
MPTQIQHRTHLLIRAGLAVLWTYAALGGATGSGALTPQYASISLIIMALVIAVWLAIRWRNRWTWHRTPLDAAFIVWAAAIILSTLANTEASARIAIGLWYALTYFGLWYLLHDALANRGLNHQLLAESLLIGGAVAMVFGYVQVGAVLASGAAPTLSALFNIRPAGTLDNPNFLGAFLMILIPYAISFLLASRSRFVRLTLIVYILLALILLALTFSRAAWIGLVAALLVMIVLLLAHHGLLSVSRIVERWRALSSRLRLALAGGGLLALVVGMVMVLVLLRSLSAAGRTADLRTYIYDAAITMFTEKPLTGYGLFTFGRGLMRLASTPPNIPHNSAHNFPLNVAAELGLSGLLALAVSVIGLIQAMRRNWRTGQHRILLVGIIASAVGISVNHLLDTVTSASPIVAIAVIMTLVLATATPEPQPAARWQARIQPVLTVGMWAALLVMGFHTVNIYREYVSVMQSAGTSGNPQDAANRLQAVINADPSMPIYHLYQGYFWGIAASNGNTDADKTAQQAISAYRRFCEMEPYYAPAWANLGALYWQIDEREQAIQAMEQAAKIAPQAWMIWANLGMYYERVGDTDAARRAYREAIALYPDLTVYPEWPLTDLRRNLAFENNENNKVSPVAKVASLLSAGKRDEATQLWKQTAPDPSNPSIYHVMSALLAAENGDRNTAEEQLATARSTSFAPKSDPWLHLVSARLARLNGDDATARRELSTARVLATSTTAMDERLVAISYAQFGKIGLPQYFLPQVYSPLPDAALVILLASSAG